MQQKKLENSINFILILRFDDNLGISRRKTPINLLNLQFSHANPLTYIKIQSYKEAIIIIH